MSESGWEGRTLTGGDKDYKSVEDKIQFTPTVLLYDNQGNLLGEALIKPGKDIEEQYKFLINEVLKSIGKPEIK